MIEQLKNNFSAFETHLNGASKSNWHQLRKEAFTYFTEHGLPKAKDEEYRYTHIGRAVEKSVDFSSLQPGSKSGLQVESPLFHDVDAIHVFISNGIVDTQSLDSSSFDGIEILTLKQAASKYPDEVEQHIGKYSNEKKDPFAALNTAFSYEGIFLKVSKNTVLNKPVILHYTNASTEESSVILSRNLMIIERGAQAQIIESYTSADSNQQFSNHVSEILVEANANLKYFKLQNQNNKAYHIDNSIISQHRDSVVKSYTFTLEGKIIRNNLSYVLEEENCEAHMFGLYVTHSDAHVDNHTSVDHKVANCYSNEIYKGILDDTSKGVFNGKIFVRQDAQKTNAFQSNKNILLTDTASVNTKPQLEIWADDVSCSHGCTTGQLDEEQLFYLRSRGINKSSAKAMLLHAFVNDVLDKIEIDFLHDFINDEMYNRLD